MGMSASQARLLSITSRMNDIEFKSQQVSNIKIRLADDSEKVANAYTQALNKQKMTFTSFDDKGNNIKTDLDSKSMASSGYELKSRDGKKIPSSYDASTLHNMIESGEYYLVKKGTSEEVSVSSEVKLALESDDKDFAKAEAEYNAATAKINKKEKQLDNEMKALDTEHQALKTEQESVKSLIVENVEKTFNLFS